MNICTIIAKNYLAQARVLARSFNEVHPDGNCTVLVIDDPSGYIDPAKEQFELLTIHDIGLPDAERMAAIYDVMELSTAVKPWLLRTLLARPGVDSVSYLDPDIQVFSSLIKIEEEAKTHGIVLTPHFTGRCRATVASPPKRTSSSPALQPRLHRPRRRQARRRAARLVVGAPRERLRERPGATDTSSTSAGSTWLPVSGPTSSLLRDTSYNIAYWNLPTRTLGNRRRRLQGRRRAAALLPLQRLRPAAPARALQAPEPDRAARRPGAGANLRRLRRGAARGGLRGDRDWPYGWDEAANGLRLDRIAAASTARRSKPGASPAPPFDPTGAAELTEYLRRRSTAPARRRSTATRPRSGSSARTCATLPRHRRGQRGRLPRWMREFGPETGASLDVLLGSPRPNGNEAVPRTPHGPTSRRPASDRASTSSATSRAERGVGEVARQILGALETRGIAAGADRHPGRARAIEKALKRHRRRPNIPTTSTCSASTPTCCPRSPRRSARASSHGPPHRGLWFWEVSRLPRAVARLLRLPRRGLGRHRVHRRGAARRSRRSR